MSAVPAAFAETPVTGGLEGTKMLAALAVSLGLHAGVAAFLDLPGHTTVPANTGTVQVRLVHAGAPTLLSAAAVDTVLKPAAMPAAVSATLPAAQPALMAFSRNAPAAVVPPQPVSARVDAVLPALAMPARPRQILKPVPKRVPRQASIAQKLSPAMKRDTQPRVTRVATPRPSKAPRSRPSGAAPSTALRAPAPVVSRSPAAAPSATVSAPVQYPPRPMVDNPRPRYPMLARRRGQQGSVLVRLNVDARGAASAVRVISSSGVASLDEAARDAVSRWRFEPARRGGRAEAATVDVPVEFRLDGNG